MPPTQPDDNPRAMMGGNNPPQPTPFELIKKTADDLYGEAKLWMDGDVVDSQELCDGIATLLGTLREGRKVADEARKEENKPINKAKQAVQDRYNPLLAKYDLAQKACKAAQTSWLTKVQLQQEEAAKIERERADRLAAEARAAITVAPVDNLVAREKAEDAIKIAERADKTAKMAEKAKPQGKSTVGSASSLRTRYVPVLTNIADALDYYYGKNPQAFVDMMQNLAEADTQAARHKIEIPGFRVDEQKYVV